MSAVILVGHPIARYHEILESLVVVQSINRFDSFVVNANSTFQYTVFDVLCLAGTDHRCLFSLTSLMTTGWWSFCFCTSCTNSSSMSYSSKNWLYEIMPFPL